MGNIFKPVVTKPVPPNAEIIERDGERTAKWRNAQGKICTAEVRTTPTGDKIVIQCRAYLARYRDGDGIVQTVATGCRDEIAARAKLGELERRAELVRSGILTSAQDATADHKRAPIDKHVDLYIASLRAKGDGERHCRNVRRLVDVVLKECRFRALRDVKRESVESWLTTGANLKRSARTRNTYLNACKWFFNWCVETERLVVNPLARIPAADEKADRRRQPRALTPDEVVRLLDAARRRPLVEAQKFNRGWRKNQNGARVRPETRAKLERLGLERALIYKTLVLSGLRLGELKAIRICDVELDGHSPHIELPAKHEKNRQGSSIPLRPDLAADLRNWIDSGPAQRDRPLFAVSTNLVKTFNRDCAFAGIEKRDQRGRTACVHGLRYTLATMLSRGGVAPKVAQAALRHSSVTLTLDLYSDPRLLDVAGALATLPEFPLSSTGATCDQIEPEFASPFALATVRS